MTEARPASAPVGATSRARCALALAVVALFYTMLVDYLFLAHSGPKPLYWMAAAAAATAGVVAGEPTRPLPLLASPFLAWVGTYFLLTTLWAVGTKGDPGATQALIDRYRSIVFLVACAALFDDPRARRVGALAVAGAVVCAAGLNVAETLGAARHLDALERVAGRSAGLYMNPNVSGLSIVFGLAVSVGALPGRSRLPLLLVGAAGVAATFSRGAELCLAALVLWLVWRKELAVWPAVLSAVLVAGAIALWSDRLVAYLESDGTLNPDTWGRIRLTADDSGRAEVALKAWKAFEGAPLAGNGLGASRTWDSSAGTHNMYLSLAVDHGVIGLVVFPALALALAAGRRRAALWPVLLVAGAFSHNLLEEGPALVCIALAAAGGPSRGTAPAPIGRGPAELAGSGAT